MLKHCTINDNSLSIVIPTFRHKLFHLVLEGFKAQTNKNFKLFIINDGGDDLTSIIKKFESSIDLEYYYLFTPENTCCLSAARNLGGSFAKTQRITFLDGDCIPSPNFVQQSSEYSFERIIVAGIRHRISEGDQNKLTNINDLETLQTKCDDRYLTEPQWRKDRLQHILKMRKVEYIRIIVMAFQSIAELKTFYQSVGSQIRMKIVAAKIKILPYDYVN